MTRPANRRPFSKQAVALAALLCLGVLCLGTGSAAALPVASPIAPAAAGAHLSWLVELEGPSVWRLYDAAGAAGETQGRDGDHVPTIATLTALRAAVARRQAQSRILLATAGATVVADYQVVNNGFLVHAPADRVPTLTRLPGVRSVARVPRLRMQLADSVPHIGADRVIEELGYDGQGATVAVIDAGIDYLHGTFGGHGLVYRYDENDENTVEPGTFPTAKVVGGYDFAGHRYSPDCARLPSPFPQCDSEPHPDDDPLEPRELSHGTPVAGIIAGEGTRLVDPGVAPGARLVALKVFGNPIGAPPTTDLALSALEWVVAHNMGLEVPGSPPDGKIDVANLSLGFPWATGLPAVNEAVSAAVATGVTVVASAGDSGPIPFVTGQPAAAELAVSVASSVPPGKAETALGIRAEWSEEGAAVTLEPTALEADFTPRLSQTGAMTEPLAWYGLACDDANGDPSSPAQDVRRKVALVERGECPFYDKLWNAADQGALAVVMFSDDRDKSVMSCTAPSDCSRAPPIPAVMIDRAPGRRLVAALEAGRSVTVTLNAELEVDVKNLTDTLSSFSSRGPSRTGTLKPQITAPGSGIHTAFAGLGVQGAQRGGTSMSAAFVSGTAALLTQRVAQETLDLGALDIAALITGHAEPVIRLEDGDTGKLASVAVQGAGRLNAWRSTRGTTVVRAQGGMAGLGFGIVHAVDDLVRAKRTILVRNLTGTARTYRLATRFAFPAEDAGRGVSVSLKPDTLTLGPYAQGPVAVELVIEPESLRPWELRGFNTIADERAVQKMEVDGYVQVVPLDGRGEPVSEESVGVPFLALPHRHACVTSSAPGALPFRREGETRPLAWSNPCGADGTAEAFALAGTDDAESAQDDSFPPVVDIEAVGVRWGPNDNNPGDALVEWAIHTRAPHRLPMESEFRIYLDLDRDGTFDRVVFNRLGRYLINMPATANRWLVAHAPLVPGTLSADIDHVTADLFGQRFDLDETVTTLQASARSLGLDLGAGDVRFNYAVASIDAAGDRPTTRTFPGQDYAPDGLETGETFAFDQSTVSCLTLTGPDGQAASAPVAGLAVPSGDRREVVLELGCDPASDAAPKGLLISYPDNMPGSDQVEIVRLLRPGPGSPVFLPLAGQDR